MAKVRKKLKDNNGNSNNSVYEITYPDGTTDEMNSNVISENMITKVDAEGNLYKMMVEISDHLRDENAIKLKYGFIRSSDGSLNPKIITRGWKLEVEWVDGSISWVKLKDLKMSNPVELSEYEVENDIDSEPAFKWWVKDTLMRRDRIISNVRARYWRSTHKFGIRVPKSLEEAYEVYRQTGTDLWTNAITKEMINVQIAFEKLEGVTIDDMKYGKVRPWYKYIRLHMIFDINMDGKFTRKERLVADGHTTGVPECNTYSSVVSRYSVIIMFMISSLNDLDICSCDIGNAYLNARCREKLWTISGPEFGSRKGSVMIISRALYGLKSSGA